MFHTTFRRSIRRRCQRAVALAIMPLAILNGLSVAEGCICADGHYEPVCRAAACRAGMPDCVSPCCANRSCCAGHSCCARLRTGHAPSEKAGEKVTFGNRCCTPLVHQTIPTVIAAPYAVARDHMPVSSAVVFEPPYSLSLEMKHTGRCVELDTGPPPNDLVVILQRLVI